MSEQEVTSAPIKDIEVKPIMLASDVVDKPYNPLILAAKILTKKGFIVDVSNTMDDYDSYSNSDDMFVSSSLDLETAIITTKSRDARAIFNRVRNSAEAATLNSLFISFMGISVPSPWDGRTMSRLRSLSFLLQANDLEEEAKHENSQEEKELLLSEAKEYKQRAKQMLFRRNRLLFRKDNMEVVTGEIEILMVPAVDKAIEDEQKLQKKLAEIKERFKDR